MLAARLASPGLSLALALLPVFTTRSTETSGSLCDSARMTGRPFFRRRRLPVGTLKACFTPGCGRAARNAASGVVRVATGCGLAADVAGGAGLAAGAGVAAAV